MVPAVHDVLQAIPFTASGSLMLYVGYSHSHILHILSLPLSTFDTNYWEELWSESQLPT